MSDFSTEPIEMQARRHGYFPKALTMNSIFLIISIVGICTSGCGGDTTSASRPPSPPGSEATHTPPPCGPTLETFDTAFDAAFDAEAPPGASLLADGPACDEPHEGYYCNANQDFSDLPLPSWDDAQGDSQNDTWNPLWDDRSALWPEPPSTPTVSKIPVQTPVWCLPGTTDTEAIFALVNAARELHGLSALSLDSNLSEAARTKATDMVTHGYFGHESPTYGSPMDLLHELGIQQCRIAAENLALSSSVHQGHLALMTSPGHRGAILDSRFDAIGVSVLDIDGRKLIVQIFCAY